MVLKESPKDKNIKKASITILSGNEEKEETNCEEKKREICEEKREESSIEEEEGARGGNIPKMKESLEDAYTEDDDYEDEIIFFPTIVKVNSFKLDKCLEEIEKLRHLYESINELTNESEDHLNPLIFLAQRIAQEGNLYEILIRGTSLSTINTALFHMKRKIFEEKEVEEQMYLEKMKDFEL